KELEWYRDRGYTIVETSYQYVNFRNGGKYYFKDNYHFKNDFNFTDVTIVGYKNLEFDKLNSSGIIFAPNGEISVQNDCDFTGIIISKKTTLNNNTKLIYKVYSDLPF
ncbi:MAG: hypothetical protein N3D72_03255, partial [Candidatus Methanomethyliaceae archaeon]|nr:hypothetical protein [Candidatus Methanomethyliaceae archaeon]